MAGHDWPWLALTGHGRQWTCAFLFLMGRVRVCGVGRGECLFVVGLCCFLLCFRCVFCVLLFVVFVCFLTPPNQYLRIQVRMQIFEKMLIEARGQLHRLDRILRHVITQQIVEKG